MLTIRFSKEDTLTYRQLEVLALAAEGNSNQMIGDALNIRESTVKNHLLAVSITLRTLDRTHVVVEAIRRGQLVV